MPEFKLVCQKRGMPNYYYLTAEPKIFYYNSETSSLLDENRNPVVEQKVKQDQKIGWNWTKDNPATKTKAIRHLKISLGLSCNYSCGYCSQRFVPNADETTKKEVPQFLERFSSWYDGGEDGLGKGTKIEFWGGEPLVYWKTLKPLAEGVKEKYPNMKFVMITNGTLLDDEKVEWIDRLGFIIGMSHDGVGYHIRGKDPLDNPKQKEMIMKLWNRLSPQGRMSINAMIHKDNISRADIQEFLLKHFGENLVIGQGEFIDAYDVGGIASSLTTQKEQIEFRTKALNEITSGKADRFNILPIRINHFIKTIETGKYKSSVTQKCGIDNPNVLTVDLKGTAITCQNISSVATAPNGESHNAGSVYDFENIKIKTVTTWQNRKNCSKCPVLHICQASCMFLEGDLFQASCDNSYSDNIVFFALAIEKLTGYLPIRVEGQHHRPDREDVWGLSGFPVEPVKQKELPKKYNFSINGATV
jgi:uncharacterized protein